MCPRTPVATRWPAAEMARLEETPDRKAPHRKPSSPSPTSRCECLVCGNLNRFGVVHVPVVDGRPGHVGFEYLLPHLLPPRHGRPGIGIQGIGWRGVVARDVLDDGALRHTDRLRQDVVILPGIVPVRK